MDQVIAYQTQVTTEEENKPFFNAENIISGLGGLFTGFIGAGNSTQSIDNSSLVLAQMQAQQAEADRKRRNTNMIMIAVAIAIAVVMFLMFKKKK